MDSSVSPKDEIWFLRVCRHISSAVYFHVFLTSARNGSEWSAPRLGRFTPGRETRYPLSRKVGGSHSRRGCYEEKNLLTPQGSEPRFDQVVALSPCRKQINKHIRAGEISHTCGVSDDSDHELAYRCKLRYTTGTFLLARDRNCYCRSAVGCVSYTATCGILGQLNSYVLYIHTYIHTYTYNLQNLP